MKRCLVVAVLAIALPASAATTTVSPYIGHAPAPLLGAAICFTQDNGWPVPTGWGCASARVAGAEWVTIRVIDAARPNSPVAFSYAFDPFTSGPLVCGATQAGPIAVPAGKREIAVFLMPDGYCRDGTPTATGGVVQFTIS